MGIVPTIDTMPRFILAHHEESVIEEAKTSPFLNDKLESLIPRSRSFAAQKRFQKMTTIGRENLARFYKAGVLIAAGTDYPFFWTPWMLHRELEGYVRAGMSPLEAIMTATRNAARLLRAENDTGTIEEGKLADLLILDANPLEDIRNTRKIWKVIQGGKIVDRKALQNWLKREAEEVAKIGK
jgi:imidazolonepropionase-like amidohydrolase